eukprot:61270-Hanusia_phi.AAC.4
MSFDPPRATKLFHNYSLTSAGNTTSSSPPACSRLSSKVCLDQRITQEEDEEEDEDMLGRPIGQAPAFSRNFSHCRILLRTMRESGRCLPARQSAREQEEVEPELRKSLLLRVPRDTANRLQEGEE